MSLPGSNSSQAGRDDEGSTLVTVMLVVATIFMVIGTIILSIPLREYYGKFLWNW